MKIFVILSLIFITCSNWASDEPLRVKWIVQRVSEEMLQAKCTKKKGPRFIEIAVNRERVFKAGCFGRGKFYEEDRVEVRGFYIDSFAWHMFPLSQSAARPDTISELKSKLDRFARGDETTNITNNWVYGPECKPKPDFECLGCDHELANERGFKT